MDGAIFQGHPQVTSQRRNPRDLTRESQAMICTIPSSTECGLLPVELGGGLPASGRQVYSHMQSMPGCLPQRPPCSVHSSGAAKLPQVDADYTPQPFRTPGAPAGDHHPFVPHRGDAIEAGSAPHNPMHH